MFDEKIGCIQVAWLQDCSDSDQRVLSYLQRAVETLPNDKLLIEFNDEVDLCSRFVPTLLQSLFDDRVSSEEVLSKLNNPENDECELSPSPQLQLLRGSKELCRLWHRRERELF